MYTILSAQYTNEAHDAATIITEERGAVAISIADKPGLWAVMLNAVTPAPYEPPEEE